MMALVTGLHIIQDEGPWERGYDVTSGSHGARTSLPVYGNSPGVCELFPTTFWKFPTAFPEFADGFPKIFQWLSDQELG